VSRQREVYISAANFLQTLSWRTQPELLTHILAFYTKAGASDSLAAFFLGCAHTELLQFKAYAKALQVREVQRARAMQRRHATPTRHCRTAPPCMPPARVQAMHEAAKHLAKSRAADAQAQLAALQGACGRVERFVRAQQGLLGADPATAVLLCQQLLAELAQQAQQQVGRLGPSLCCHHTHTHVTCDMCDRDIAAPSPLPPPHTHDHSATHV
jgi:intraflagellar transport protein 140